MTSPNTIIADMQAEIDALQEDIEILMSAVELSFDAFNHHAAPYLHHEVQVSEAHDACIKAIISVKGELEC